VTLGGSDLEGFHVDEPAASVRLLLPSSGELVIPTWNGNEFLLPNGQRPLIRTFTPRRFDPDTLELDLDIVLHEDGAASTWATAAKPGDPVAISGPGRGYTIDPNASAFLLAGDETAIPAISQLLETLPHVPVNVHVEITRPDARLELPLHPGSDISWHVTSEETALGDRLLTAIESADLTPSTHIWAAGEAAAMHRIRRHLFEKRNVPRSHATVRGYWKYGRTGS